MGNLKHRADIDGLRAVAILPVVMFHAFPSLVGGGFIGVDVFFVISGYLISSIVFVELAQRRFSYRVFYARRVRRLAPALILVLATTLAAGWLELFPHEFASLGENVAGGAAFVSNFVLYGQSGYFDAASEAKPLLHLWSLGIEEQFYIVWPFLLTLLPGRKAFLGCVVLLLVSFALNVYVTRTENAAEAFYFPFTRWWELMAGAALGWIVVFQPFSSRYREVISATGLLLILGAAVGLHKGIQFPGWWALVPVLGAVALIASDGAWVNRKILSSVPMVSIGLISYPLYLWHWPLLAFARVELGAGQSVAAADCRSNPFELRIRCDNLFMGRETYSLRSVGQIGRSAAVLLARRPGNPRRSDLLRQGLSQPDFGRPAGHHCGPAHSKAVQLSRLAHRDLLHRRQQERLEVRTRMLWERQASSNFAVGQFHRRVALSRARRAIEFIRL